MSKDKTLQRRLAALSKNEEYGNDGARLLAKAHIPLATILEEIDTTVMPARLRFIAGKRWLEALVSERRLRKITGMEPALPAPRPGFETAFTGEDAGATTDAVTLLAEFAGQSKGNILVTSEAVELAPGDAGIGLSVDMIIGAMQAPDPAPEEKAREGTRIRRLMDGLGDTATAYIYLVDGRRKENGGDEAHGARLKLCRETQLANFDADRVQVVPGYKNPSMTCLNETLADGIGVSFAVCQNEILIFSYRTEDLAKTLNHWRNSK